MLCEVIILKVIVKREIYKVQSTWSSFRSAWQQVKNISLFLSLLLQSKAKSILPLGLLLGVPLELSIVSMEKIMLLAVLFIPLR